MKIEKSSITKILITDIDRLDPVSVYAEDLGPHQGKITITCYGKAWTAYWSGMGDLTISEFFVSCDEHYIANKLSDINSESFDIDAIRKDAEEKGVECWRDDPWNDYEFMKDMYGPDMVDWSDKLPKKTNHEYEYLCRIIKAVQYAFRVKQAA